MKDLPSSDEQILRFAQSLPRAGSTTRSHGSRSFAALRMTERSEGMTKLRSRPYYSGSLLMSSADGSVFFHPRLEPQERLVPALRDRIERAAGLVERRCLQPPELLAPPAHVPREARLRQYPQVLCDRLARDARAVGQTRDGEWAFAAQAGDQTPTRPVAQGSEHGRRPSDRRGLAARATPPGPHRWRCSGSVPPSRASSCGTPRPGARAGSGQSRTRSPSDGCLPGSPPARTPPAWSAPSSSPAWDRPRRGAIGRRTGARAPCVRHGPRTSGARTPGA